MDSPVRFRINAPRVIHELFEHEVVVVNLDTGRYYCLRHTGADLWNGLIAGASLDELTAALSAAYQEPDAVVLPAVVAAIDDLKREDLVVEAASGDVPRQPWEPHAAPGASFERPALETYTDMQDLLLLDPIHEVDAAGWPVPADPVKRGPASDPQ